MISNSKLSAEATRQVELIDFIIGNSVLVYSLNEKRREENESKVVSASFEWDRKQRNLDMPEVKKNKDETTAILAQVVIVSDDLPSLKHLEGRFVKINSHVGKTYWLSQDKVEELTLIESSAIYSVLK